MSLFDPASLEKKLTLLEDLTKEDGFWNDNDKAQRVMKEKKSIESSLNEYREISRDLEDLEVLVSLAEEAGDETMVPEIQEAYREFTKKAENLRIKTLLKGE